MCVCVSVWCVVCGVCACACARARARVSSCDQYMVMPKSFEIATNNKRQ